MGTVKRYVCDRGHPRLPGREHQTFCYQCKQAWQRRRRETAQQAMKVCRACGAERPRSAFENRGAGVACRTCREAGWRYGEMYNAEKKFGMTWLEYVTLIKGHDGTCEMCGGRIIGRVHLDHDHASGKVRGLLCARCNTNLWVLEDEIFVRNAKAYLARHK